MISSLVENLNCPACDGVLAANEYSTYLSYAEFTHLPVHKVSSAVDDLLNNFVVYVCTSCGAQYRYTIKDIEKRFRIDIMKKVLNGVVRGEINPASAHWTGALFYCGKCSGYDGQGSCPRKILDKCEIKRLPNVF